MTRDNLFVLKSETNAATIEFLKMKKLEPEGKAKQLNEETVR